MLTNEVINNGIQLISLAKKAVKNGLYGCEPNVKIAVLGTDSIQYLCSVLRYILYEKYSIKVQIFEGEFNGIMQALMDESSEYYKFKPNITVIIPSSRDIIFKPFMADAMTDYSVVTASIESESSRLMALCEKCISIGSAVFLANLVIPDLASLGNLEADYLFSTQSYLRALNLKLASDRPTGVTMIDFDSLASSVGKRNWIDYTSYFLSKQGFALEYTGLVADLVAHQVSAFLGYVKKVLVLDLDNTLWGGVISEDGVDEIQLDPNNALGEAYRFFQTFILSLKERGVILAVCSKNDEEVAKSAFLENEFMILKLDDIASFVANWEDKATNIRRIASMLELGVDSLVFFDDNPAEREIVRQNVPEVTVIEVPNDPALYARALSDSHAFDWIQLTIEDISRSSTYMSNTKRTQLLSSAVDYDAYIASLKMEYTIGTLDESRVPRFTQLIGKSNQFNLRTIRYSEAEILEMMADPLYTLVYAELKDCFDNYGLISCMILHEESDSLFVDTWVMSCRVLKRNVENRMLEFVKKLAESLELGEIVGEYLPTAKNKMVRELYSGLGFETIESTDEKGVYKWQM